MVRFLRKRGKMIKAGEELLKLQKENQELKAKVYALSSQIISVEQDKIDLANKIKAFKEGIDKTREEMETEYKNSFSLHNRDFWGLYIAIGIFNKYLPKESEGEDAN